MKAKILTIIFLSFFLVACSLFAPPVGKGFSYSDINSAEFLQFSYPFNYSDNGQTIYTNSTIDPITISPTDTSVSFSLDIKNVDLIYNKIYFLDTSNTFIEQTIALADLSSDASSFSPDWYQRGLNSNILATKSITLNRADFVDSNDKIHYLVYYCNFDATTNDFKCGCNNETTCGRWSIQYIQVQESSDTPQCGDGNIDAGEACDDGNIIDSDGCPSDCLAHMAYSCIDSGRDVAVKENVTLVLVAGANTSIYDSCSSQNIYNLSEYSCLKSSGNYKTLAEAKSDLVLEVNSTCSSGNYCNTTSDTCVSLPPSICGNSVIDVGESCDDGNIANGDGCSSSCIQEVLNNYNCQSLLVDGTARNESQGGLNQTQEATVQIRKGSLVPGSGNIISVSSPSDRCSSTNIIETYCKAKNGTYSADNAAITGLFGTMATVVCSDASLTCQSGTCLPPVPVCGDGSINQANEICDDGNTIEGDGCPSDCLKHYNYTCVKDNTNMYNISRKDILTISTFGSPTGTTYTLGEVCTGAQPYSSVIEYQCRKSQGYYTTAAQANTDMKNQTTVSCPTNYCSNGACADMPVIICGNNIIDVGESCDDGNAISGDGCSSICIQEVLTAYNCTSHDSENYPALEGGTPPGTDRYAKGTVYVRKVSNGQLISATNTDSCSGSQVVETYCTQSAGNYFSDSAAVSALVATGSANDCDQDYTCNNGKCVATQSCGNGIIESPEVCDDGNIIGTDWCSSDCSSIKYLCSDNDPTDRVAFEGTLTVSTLVTGTNVGDTSRSDKCDVTGSNGILREYSCSSSQSYSMNLASALSTLASSYVNTICDCETVGGKGRCNDYCGSYIHTVGSKVYLTRPRDVNHALICDGVIDGTLIQVGLGNEACAAIGKYCTSIQFSFTSGQTWINHASFTCDTPPGSYSNTLDYIAVCQ